MYRDRKIEDAIKEVAGSFPCIVVYGSRQVGKSTMLKHLAEGQGRTYVSMDDTQLRTFAQSESYFRSQVAENNP